MREFCAENRVSLRFPVGLGAPVAVVLKGKLEKLVPRPLPVFVDLMIAVISRKPPMSRSASPTCMARGEEGWPPPVCSPPLDPPVPPVAGGGSSDRLGATDWADTTDTETTNRARHDKYVIERRKETSFCADHHDGPPR